MNLDPGQLHWTVVLGAGFLGGALATRIWYHADAGRAYREFRAWSRSRGEDRNEDDHEQIILTPEARE